MGKHPQWKTFVLYFEWKWLFMVNPLLYQFCRLKLSVNKAMTCRKRFVIEWKTMKVSPHTQTIYSITK